MGQEIEIAFKIGGERTLVRGCVLAIKCGASGALTYSVKLANARVDPEHTLELIELQSVIHAFEPPDAQFAGGPSSASQQQWCTTDEAHIADYIRRELGRTVAPRTRSASSARDWVVLPVNCQDVHWNLMTLNLPERIIYVIEPRWTMTLAIRLGRRVEDLCQVIKVIAKQQRCDWRCGYIVVYWAVYMRFALAGGVVLDMEHPPEMPLEFVGLTQLILSALGSLRAGELATTLGLHTFMTDAIDSGVLDFAAMQVQLEEFMAERAVHDFTAAELAVNAKPATRVQVHPTHSPT